MVFLLLILTEFGADGKVQESKSAGGWTSRRWFSVSHQKENCKVSQADFKVDE